MVTRAESHDELQHPADRNYMSRQTINCDTATLEIKRQFLGSGSVKQICCLETRGSVWPWDYSKMLERECYSPGEWHHRRLAEDRVVGRSPFTAPWAWRSQIPKFASQKTPGSMHCGMSPRQPQPPSTQLRQHMAARWSGSTLLSAFTKGTESLSCSYPGNIYRSSTSHIRPLTSSACQFFVYHSGPTKHKGN